MSTTHRHEASAPDRIATDRLQDTFRPNAPWPGRGRPYVGYPLSRPRPVVVEYLDQLSLSRIVLGLVFVARQPQHPSQLGRQRVAVEQRFAGRSPSQNGGTTGRSGLRLG